MRVLLTEEAQVDLERIADYIAADNPSRAATFVEEVVACCETLANMPERFPLVPRFAAVGIRRRSHGSYLILYRIRPSTVEVIHILHGAREVEAILARSI